jgi:NAD(P)-dependent dehydrogenase (short-subunit alcohol dehydrogenase family)
MQMDIRLEGKVIAITGAGRGLGRAMALGLAREGARVALLDVDEEQAARTAKEITAAVPGKPEPLTLTTDVTDEDQVARAAHRIDQHWGRVDALINNAGWMPPVAPVLELSTDMLRRVIDVNLIGCFLTTKHFAPIMIREGGGRILYISSMIGVQANPGQSAYGATKAGVTILANVAHRELANHGIRTVALAPGLTDTPGMRASVDDDYIDSVSSKYPGGRLGQPDDVVAFAAFLCSEAASHLSGTLVPIRPVAG